MTGYGAAELDTEALRASATIRSLNHRFLELELRVPRRFGALEPEIKSLIQSRLRRGRVELALQVTRLRAAGDLVVAARPLVGALVRALREIQSEHALEGGVSVADVARFPGALEVVEAPGVLEDVRAPLLELVARALENLEAMRAAEGANLARDLESGLDAMAGALERMGGLSDAAKLDQRELLARRVRELSEELGLEDARLYQEIVRQAERADVTEELQRLRSHLRQFRQLLGAAEPAGRRLDFLAQELMREANTLGSKSPAPALTAEVVGFKSVIERLREQVQNVE